MAVPANFKGWGRVVDSSLSNLAAFAAGQKRFELGTFALTTQGANTAAVLFGMGTATTPVDIGTTASKNFIGFWCNSSATSGDSRLMYLRLYLGGTSSASGETARIFTTVKTGAVASSAHGAHISLSFQTTGYCSGLGVASRNTLHIPDQASWSTGGTYAATQAEIWSDGAASDTAVVTEVSFLRCVNGGNASGIADVDDDAHLIVYDGGSTASGNVVESSTTEANYAYSIRVKMNGTVMYLMAASAVG